MRSRPLLTAFAVMLAALRFSVPGFAQDGTIRAEARPDWERNRFRVLMEAELPREGTNLPAGRVAAERAITAALPVRFRELAADLTVDSSTTAGERMMDDPRLRLQIEELAARGTRNLSRLSLDLSRLSVSYGFSLFPQIGSLFVRHQEPYDPPSTLEYVPSASYTGLVIHARGRLPVHGTSDSRFLTPSLFPRIFDEQTMLLLEKEMMNPDVLRRRGVVAYTDGTDETPFRDRIGDRPLRTMAVGLFGKYATDPLIPAEAARQLLARPENRRLLQEGRILVICNLPRSGPESEAQAD